LAATERGTDLLAALNVAKSLNDLSPLKSIGLHKLRDKGDAHEVEIVDCQRLTLMAPVVHPGRLLKRELAARKLSANRLSLDIGVPSGRVTDILNGRRSITADTAVRLGRYFGNGAQFWLDLQSQYDIGVVEREKGAEIAKRVRPADAA
jgi:addiction module HigA family antidote